MSATHGYSDIGGLLKWLDKYPYGCIEQTTSRAMPLLVFNDLTDLAGLPKDQALRGRLQDAVDAVLDMQNYAGNFGMWGPGSDADPWISAYALDFLYQAKDKGYVVPNDALKRGAGWLRQTVDLGFLRRRHARLRILHPRARGPGESERPALLQRHARSGMDLGDGGGADRCRGGGRGRPFARVLWLQSRPRHPLCGQARELLGRRITVRCCATSRAPPRSRSESNEAELIPAFLAKSDTIDMRLNATTTQEKAWMLRAAYELTRQHTQLHILVNNQPAQLRAGAVRLAPNLQQLAAGITLANKGDAGVWRTTSVEGTPAIPLPAESSNVTLKKTIWTMTASRPISPT